MITTRKIIFRKNALLRVLVAVANTIKEVGYTQGLNGIAGVFLFFLKEEETFWAMLYLLEKMKVKEIFKKGFPKVEILNYQFKLFLEYYLPGLYTYFVRSH